MELTLINTRAVDGNRWGDEDFVNGLHFSAVGTQNPPRFEFENSCVVEELLIAIAAIFVARFRAESDETGLGNGEIDYFLIAPYAANLAVSVLEELIFNIEVDLMLYVGKSIQQNILRIPNIMDEYYVHERARDISEDDSIGRVTSVKAVKEEFLRAVVLHLIESEVSKIVG